MRPTRNLQRLRLSASANLVRLRHLAFQASIGPQVRQTDLIVSHVAIQAITTWSNFTRAYYLSLVLHPKLESGNRVIVDALYRRITFDQAIGYAIAQFNRKARARPSGAWDPRHEPPWRRTDVLDALCSANLLDASHYAQVQAALAVPTAAFSDLPLFRNFYAHRNHDTATLAMQRAPQYGIPATLHPTSILLRRPLARHQPLILDWLDDILRVIELLCH